VSPATISMPITTLRLPVILRLPLKNWSSAALWRCVRRPKGLRYTHSVVGSSD
jgi:hypothetical protein